MVIIPAAGGIAAAFPAAGPGIINYILTGPTLFMAIFSLLSGKFSQYISDKKLMIIGFGVLTVGAIFGAAFQNIYYLAFMRSFGRHRYGASRGMAMAIISKTFVSESKRVAMIGIYNGAMWLSGRDGVGRRIRRGLRLVLCVLPLPDFDPCLDHDVLLCSGCENEAGTGR